MYFLVHNDLTKRDNTVSIAKDDTMVRGKSKTQSDTLKIRQMKISLYYEVLIYNRRCLPFCFVLIYGGLARTELV